MNMSTAETFEMHYSRYRRDMTADVKPQQTNFSVNKPL